MAEIISIASFEDLLKIGKDKLFFKVDALFYELDLDALRISFE